MLKVSVVVPVYNVEKYLSKCLDSLVKQTLKEIEIILVNDGSTDGSQKIIDEYTNKYPKIVRSYQKINGGLSDARNFGIQFCKGEYIGFVDSDDYVNVEMFEKMYKLAHENSFSIVACDYYKVYPQKIERVNARAYDNSKEMFIDTLAAAWNKIYLRELINKLKVCFPKGLIYEDTEFFCKLIPYVKRIGHISEPFVYYVQREGSIANTQGNKTAQIFDIMTNIVSYYKDNNKFEEFKEELEYLFVKILFGSSMERISRISDSKFRNRLLYETLDLVEETFPNWRKNKYIYKSLKPRNIYMKLLRRWNITIISTIVGKVYSFKYKKLYS